MILARGVDEYNNFRMDEKPTGDFDDKSIAEHDNHFSEMLSTVLHPHAASNYATS